MKILRTIYEWHNKDFDTTCGLYQVELDSGSKHYFLRNNDSIGAIQHIVGKPASECVAIMRNDVRQEFLNKLKERKEDE